MENLNSEYLRWKHKVLVELQTCSHNNNVLNIQNMGIPKPDNVADYLYHPPKSCVLHVIRSSKSLS